MCDLWYNLRDEILYQESRDEKIYHQFLCIYVDGRWRGKRKLAISDGWTARFVARGRWYAFRIVCAWRGVDGACINSK